MVKTIYGKLVITFIGVVAVSIIITFLLTNLFYQRKASDFLEQRMIEDATEITRIQSKLPAYVLPDWLQSMSKLQFNILLIREDGRQLHFGNQNDRWQIDNEIVQSVLAGNTYRGMKQFGYRPGFVGVPFTRNGVHYAIFLRPASNHSINQFGQMMMIVLSVTIVVGTILFLVAARLLSKPIRTISQAMKQVAKGDYNVQVEVTSRDEIGELSRIFNMMTKELSSIEAMRQEFVSNVSHEIRTPLTSIRGFARALSQTANEQEAKYLQIIEQESERLSKISANLLKLASLDTIKLNMTRFGLDEQIRMAVAACVPLWSVKQLHIEADLRKVEIDGDEDLLNQVWMNLLSNSIKFTPNEGQIHIQLTSTPTYATIIITDSGIGIAEEDIPRIFDRFYKADRSRTSQTSGSGLGLSIVRKIVKLHGGNIEIRSQLDKGTSVIVTLPLYQYK
ncbi:HAMP domain-containing sensor histidine kinase [Paenibacillus sediminis]|uniref:Heme sensor protein HssS n=1 Tax=Paenibacillus sediminis TaxID=664909 RepID=A0ABS4H3N0_9BACL|nr:HAMP domain-containing sensor histidine kinase [Paenibacillus sediminis]MBP1937143.1 signal transduction histidine kinase [Paenibacillus sediminis]